MADLSAMSTEARTAFRGNWTPEPSEDREIWEARLAALPNIPSAAPAPAEAEGLDAGSYPTEAELIEVAGLLDVDDFEQFKREWESYTASLVAPVLVEAQTWTITPRRVASLRLLVNAVYQAGPPVDPVAGKRTAEAVADVAAMVAEAERSGL
jgi:hypothetical protein